MAPPPEVEAAGCGPLGEVAAASCLALDASKGALSELDALRLEVEELRSSLCKALDDNRWWSKECRRLEKEFSDESSAWHNLRVSSTLTSHSEWRSLSSEGWMWKHFEAACPCCKRPLDVTFFREESSKGTYPCSEARDGAELRCVRLPPWHEKTPIFASPSSYDTIGALAVGDVVVAAGMPERVAGCTLVPVRPAGVIDAFYFEVVGAGAEAEAAAEEERRGEDKDDAERYVQNEVEARVGVAGTVEKAEEMTTLRFAYCAAIWGASAGYALGAAVLGARLRELSMERGGEASDRPPPERVLLHTDDVPPNFLGVLGKVWTLRKVEYIEGVEQLYRSKGTAFDGVFTKLAAWGLSDYDKVLLLDIDIVLLQDPQPLFDLQTPAALVRGNSSQTHGCAVNGQRFFCGEEEPFAWCQGGGINAGVILLRPCDATLDRMIAEVTCEDHPEHVRGAGPEQDYLSRFFAWAPWHAMDVRWNYQVHHIPFALEAVLEWYREELKKEHGTEATLACEDQAWLPPRLTVDLDDVAIVHFSGDVKPWHLILDAVQDSEQRRAVEHEVSLWENVDDFGEHLLRHCCESHKRWLARTASAEEYAEFGVELTPDGRFELLAGPNLASGSDSGLQPPPQQQRRRRDVTGLVEGAMERLRGTTRRALLSWRNSADAFLTVAPSAIVQLRKPAAPLEGCFAPGALVEVQWPPEAAAAGWTPYWLPAAVVSVHADGRHVVRFERGGSWGDTERGVLLERLRLRSTDTCE